MCEECHSWPHVPGCQNAPEGKWPTCPNCREPMRDVVTQGGHVIGCGACTKTWNIWDWLVTGHDG